MSEIKVSLVVAVAENGVIGKENGLPWRLPEDLKYFKRITMGHPIVMGRLTYESIGRPLPGRQNIVVTRQKDWSAEGVEVVHSLPEALSAGKDAAKDAGLEQVMLIGGAELYRQAIDQAHRLYLTEVHSPVEGDAYFPEFDREKWREMSRERYSADASNPYSYSFVLLER